MPRKQNGSKRIALNRRTVLKAIGVGVVGGVGFSSNVVAQPMEKPPKDEPTWGSDGTDHWQLMDANSPTDSDHTAHRPLYGIAPAKGAHSPHGTHGSGPHDHVVDTPASQEPFTAEWHVFVLKDKNGELSNGGFSGFSNPPTISKIDDLVATTGHQLADTGFEFTCPVQPHDHQGDDPNSPG